MPTIVRHYEKKTGKIRVYESTPHYDPLTKQSRPKRKYLGTLDSETGELIPSSGQRGRKASRGNTPTTKSDKKAAAKISNLERTISNRDAEIAALKSEIATKNTMIESYTKICNSISNIIAKVPDRL